MKILKYIFIIFLFSPIVYSQTIDTLAVVKIANLFKPSKEVLEFDLMLTKTSFKWFYFTNATFHIDIPIQYNIDYNNIEVNLIKTELPVAIQVGNEYPNNGYYIQSYPKNNTLSLSVLGPNIYTKSMFIPLDSSVLIGKFRIISRIGQYIPEALEWKKPLSYYQAIAYKTERDSLILDDIIWYHIDDNIEISDGVRNLVVYENPQKPKYETILKDFIVEYDRAKRTKYQWIMKSEYNVYGYTVARALKPEITMNESLLKFDTVASCMPGSSVYNPQFLSKGNSINIDQAYGVFEDSVRYRSVQYCYNLYAHFIDDLGNISPPVLLATRCPYIPNAVIVQAEMVDPQNYPAAKASPTVRFKLDDDCYVTGYIIDAVGRKVENLTVGQTNEIMVNLKMNRGEYVSSYTPPPYVANGYYQFIIQAIPIDDNSVEISSTIVPFYLIRSD